MRHSIYLLGIFLFFFQLGFSQILKQTIRGTVIDQETSRAIEGANVIVLRTEPLIGSSSNDKGEFRLENVPIGRYDIKVSFTGFESKLVTDVFIKSGKESIIDIELQSSIISLKSIEINNTRDVNNEMTVVSTRTFSVEETKRYPASINDPSRMVMSYAGVVSGNDRDNEIIIRGNSPRGLLWRLEGVEIPSPNHFSTVGTSSGAVSMLSSTMLANSDFMTGAFPSEYGNATSGVFDVKLRNGNNEKREYTLQAGFLGIDLGAEGPIKKGKGASYLFNYRYSSVSLFDLVGYKIPGDAIPKFQDLSFKLFFPTNKAGIFSLYGLGGLSSVVNNKQENFDYNLGNLGLSHQFRINDNNYVKSIASFYNKAIFSQGEKPTSSYQSSFLDYSIGLSINVNSKINAKNTLKTGVIYNKLDYNYSEEDYDFLSGVRNIYTDEEGNTYQSQAYVSWKYRINKNFSLVNGIHGIWMELNNRYSIEPRSAIKMQIDNSQSLSFAFGLHSKIDALLTYLDKTKVNNENLRLNQNLDFSKSLHYILSYDKTFGKKIYFRSEIYYQNLYNIPISPDRTSNFSILNSGSGFPQGKLVNEGTGQNYGIEITLDKKFDKNYFYLITASIFESTYKAADQVERNTAHNSNYVSNYIFGKEFWIGEERKKMIRISTRVNWAGGKRYTPIDLEASRLSGDQVLQKGEYFSEKINDYFRIDLQIGYFLNRSKFNSELRLDVQNLTNRRNIFEIYYDNSKKEIIPSYQLGLVPAISYRVEF